MDQTDIAVFSRPLSVITLGVDMFAESLEEQGVAVLRVDWRPPSEEAAAVLRFLPLLDD